MSTEFKYIVRLSGKDLKGTNNVVYALTQIKGVNIRLANILIKKANIPPETRLGFLSDNNVRKLEETLNNIETQGLPVWMLNRRKDMATGRNIHLITSDLDLQIKEDREGMIAMKSWRGYRHAYGLKVRGQRTRTTGRKGKITGVRKKRGV
jgi:small subunit ribosomal protein S13